MVDHIIVLPGGGYHRHAPHEGEPVAAWLRSIGHEASVFEYPVLSRHPITNDAIQDAVRTRRAAGADRVGVLGFSAGGHAGGLAAMTGSGDARIDLAILCYPVVSMVLDTHAGSRENLIGLDAPDSLRRATSLELLVTKATPPMFIWHTAADAAVPVGHSYLLGKALAAHTVPHSLHVFPHGKHGIGLATGEGTAEAWTSLCAAWLSEAGWQ
jgi:acetyl esterase/lipase